MRRHVGWVALIATGSATACTLLATFDDRSATNATNDASVAPIDGSFVDVAADTFVGDATAIDAEDAGALTDGSDCDGADLTSNANSCGVCGHDCLGAACTNGQCQPRILSPERNMPTAIAVADGTIYFAEGGSLTLSKMPAGGGLSTVIATTTTYPYSVKAGDGGLYWGAERELFFTPADGGATDLVSFHVTFGGDHVAFDDTSVFITDYGGAGSVYKGARESAGARDAGLALLTSMHAPSNVFVDPSDVAITNDAVIFSACGAYPDGGGFIDTIPKTGGSPSSFASGEHGIQAIATDGASLFWVNGGYAANDGALKVQSLTGGVQSTLANGLKSPRALVLDGNYVYVANAGTAPAYTDGSIVRFDATATAANAAGGVVMASPQTQPNAIAVDAQAVYWTSFGTMGGGGTASGTGAILRVAK